MEKVSFSDTYEYNIPIRLLGGENAVKKNSGLLSSLGKRALLVTGKHSAIASGAQQDMISALEEQKIAWELYNEIGENPLLESCREAARLAAQFRADFIIGIGGGSPMDAAKAVAALVTDPELPEADVFARNWKTPPLPVVVVGTTSGTGSEISSVSVLTCPDGRKRSISGIFPALSFGDPRYTYSMSRAATITTSLDALAHAAEGYFAPKCSRISAAFAEIAIPVLWKNLWAVYQGEEITEEMHKELYEASLWAGFVLAANGTAFPHPYGYVLTEQYDIPHGRACTTFFPALFHQVEEANPSLAKRFLELCECTREEMEKCLFVLSDTDHITMSDEKIESLRERFDGIKHYANVPGGYDADKGLEVFRQLFGSGKKPRTKVLLVRHCEATGNTDGVFQGRIDTDISENGAKQLAQLALRCRNMKIDAVVSSPLLRAMRTAEAVDQFHHLSVEQEPLLAEIDAGGFEGVPWAELPVRFPEEARQWYDEPWNFHAPQGETMAEVRERVWKGLTEVVKRHPGETICIVSHGCAIRNLLCRALGWPLEKIGDVPWMDNTAISILDFSGEDCVQVPMLGDASHLTPETSKFAAQAWWSK